MPIPRPTYAFVGRREELTLFEELLSAPVGAGSVVYIGAPAGLGKSRLLDAYSQAAEEAGTPTLRLSASRLPPVPKRIHDLIDGALVELGGRGVVLLDDFQVHARLERWYGNELLPSLASRAIVVVAGRGRLEAKVGDRLRREIAFEEHALPPLAPDDAEALLAALGVERARMQGLIDTAGGVPLVLEELARILREQGPRARGLRPRQEALATLFRSMHLDIPTDEHRRALWATALAAPLSPRLLAATVDSADTRSHYRWLAKQTFVCADRDRLWPQPVYRDAAMLDLLRSAPTQYRTMVWRAGQFLLAQFNSQRTAETRRETIAALLHLQRAPASATHGGPEGEAAPRAASSAHDAQLARLALEERDPGVPKALLDALRYQPAECTVLWHSEGEVLGLMHFAPSTGRQGRSDRARQALDHVDRLSCIDRPGRRRKTQGPRALVCSAWLSPTVDADSPVVELAYQLLLERTLSPPDLRIMALRTDISHPLIVEAAQQTDLLRAPPATDPLDPAPHRHPSWLLLRDNDRDPPGKWLRMQLGRAISGQEDRSGATEVHAGGEVEISRTDFSDAVRQALPRLGNPTELVGTALAAVTPTEGRGKALGVRQFISRGLEVMSQSKHSRADARRLRRHYGIGDQLTPAEPDELRYDSPGEIRAAEDRLVSALWQEHVQRLRARSSA